MESGERNFYTEPQIIERVKDRDNTEGAKAMNIFRTSRQRTWLVSTKQSLHCVLDDIRKERPNINWSIPRSRLVKDGDIELEITTHDRLRRPDSTAGLVDIGPNHQNWLYTKRLFAQKGIEERIHELVRSTMVNG